MNNEQMRWLVTWGQPCLSHSTNDKTSEQVARNLEVVSFTPIVSRPNEVPVTPEGMASSQNPAAVALPYIKVMLFVTTHI